MDANDWNRNGETGRIVTDSLIIKSRDYLAPGGEILFIATSKQGAKLTLQMMETYWGKGIRADGNDPLDYSIKWQERGDANWAVVKRLNLRLANYYYEFLPLYKQMVDRGESEPVIKIDGELYQKLYFIRARKND